MKRAPDPPGKLAVEVSETYGKMSQAAADVIAAELKRSPDLLLCASAGGTPTGMYQCLAARYSRQPRLFSRMRILQIDEWGGLPPTSPATCAADLHLKLTSPLRIPPARYCGFHTEAANPERECDRISRWLDANGPIDICILGLGANGHIAMNEPNHALIPSTHVARLARSSQQHGMLKDLSQKPRFGFTLGMREILASRQILLLVSGSYKKSVLKRLLHERVTSDFPASFLWLHPHATVLCDRDAAGKI
jgi:galactosamine-6-phosphate isomerase